jgi:hypothetical protein
MDNYTIQTLITQGRVVSSGDVDPNNTYVQIGVWQPGNRKRNASNDAYPSYVIPLSQISSQQVIDVLGTTLYSTNPPAGPNFNTNDSIFLGRESGYNATNSFYSVFLGPYSGREASNSYYSNIIGYQAGAQSNNLSGCNIFGFNAGYGSGSYGSVMIGSSAGQYTGNNSYESVFIGTQAGDTMTSSNRSVATGWFAGRQSSSLPASVLIGQVAGANTSSCPALVSVGSYAGWGGERSFNFFGPVGRNTFGNDSSVFVGDSAGIGADQAKFTVAIGFQAGGGLGGQNTKNGVSNRNVFIGRETGVFSYLSNDLNAMGYRACLYANNLNYVNSIGYHAGYGSYIVSQSTFIGHFAGAESHNLSDSIFIGNQAGRYSTGSNVIALGRDAGILNPVSNCFIISNNNIQEFPTEAAAITYFTTAPAGNTYLYWDSTNGKLEAIRK